MPLSLCRTPTNLIVVLASCALVASDETACVAEAPAALNATAIAVVLRGEVFRGLPHKLPRDWRDRFACEPSTFALQRAVSRSHVATLIAPLEAAGAEVDVLLASYGCGADVASALEQPGVPPSDWEDELVGWYGGAARVAARDLRVPRAGATQQTLVRRALELVADASAARAAAGAAPYAAALLWRFDLIAMAPLGRAYLDAAGARLMTHGIDHAWSLPAALLGCARAILDGGCAVVDSNGGNGRGENLVPCTRALGARARAAAAAGRGGLVTPGKLPGASAEVHVVRDDGATVGGAKVCKHLAAEYDAPRCDAHATAARYCKAIAAHEAKAPLDRQDRAVIEEQLGCAKIGVVLGAGPARDLRR